MTVYFEKIHLGNYWYAYVKSWFCVVRFVAATVPKRWLTRFQPLHFDEIFTSDEWVMIRDETWSEWAKLVTHVPVDGWRACVFGRSVDFHRIALQHLAWEYLAHRYLMRSLERIGPEGEIRVADSVFLRYICAFGPIPGLEGNARIRIDRGAWIWDLLYRWGRVMGWAAYLIMQALYALRAGPVPGRIDVLHEGLSHSESGSGVYELSFSWLREQGVCAPGHIIFVLASRPKREAPDILRQHAMLRGLGGWAAARALGYGFSSVTRSLFHVPSLVAILLTEFRLRCIAPYLLAAMRGIRTYLTTVPGRAPEHPCVALYNAMGIRTILWTYSANLALFNEQYRSAGRYFYAAHMETAECWLWSEHHQALWRRGEILPSRTKFRLIGPAMMGSPVPCLMPAVQSRRAFLGLSGDGSSLCRNVAVFDIPPRRGELARVLGPLVITLEGVDAFYQHLARLLETFSDIRLIVKTKREHPNKQKPPALKALVAPQSEWVRSGRVIYLDPDINPYIPIGAADLTIGLPFTSPVLAGLHFGRRGLYHDPLQKALHHDYHELEAMISHGYEDLERKVRYWLYLCNDREFQAFLDRPETRRFLGPRPGADPAEEFGKALCGDGFSFYPSGGTRLREQDVRRPASPSGLTSSQPAVAVVPSGGQTGASDA